MGSVLQIVNVKDRTRKSPILIILEQGLMLEAVTTKPQSFLSTLT
jgi:hypothetical protein